MLVYVYVLVDKTNGDAILYNNREEALEFFEFYQSQFPNHDVVLHYRVVS